MTPRSLLLLLALTSVAHAGPPEFAHFEPQRFVAAEGGVWLVGVDNCDEGGTTPAARWLGPGAQPAISPVPQHARRFDRIPVDPALATLPEILRAHVRAVAHSAADASLVYAVGLDGFVAVSTDGAQHWFVQTSHTKEDLDAVWIRSRTEVYAAGARGTLIVAREGKPWTVDAKLGALVHADHTLFGVWGVDDDRYVATGESAFASHDAGRTWAVIKGAAFSGIGGSSADLIYGIGNPFGGLSLSRDRGKTWERALSSWWSGHRCIGGS